MGSVGKATSGVGAKGSAAESLRTELSKGENRIRYDHLETAIVYDKDGNVILDKTDGMPDAVYFTDEQSAKFKDTIFTHNHPSGSTFSAADLNLAVMKGVREMRACHADGAYVLTRNYEIGDPIPVTYLELAQDYKNAYNSYRTNVVDPIYYASAQDLYTADKCNRMIAEYRKNWLKEHAKEYGWTYKEEHK